jgi:hypothetical protein
VYGSRKRRPFQETGSPSAYLRDEVGTASGSDPVVVEVSSTVLANETRSLPLAVLTPCGASQITSRLSRPLACFLRENELTCATPQGKDLI